ncbi:pyruvate dehydrogenase (acetyl-transferring), homodimeric type [Persicimonas caeni]|uniref:Pyruvate dehydrogenase E1 component n=1 Tax=Persicimonas caeni TaxID=2292766 RepID=A0A4Y6Q1Z6_PERCE|nr:pyruvate dehydrogenase (acetyl-transferring), homodimeric type [Persicimonas caeni]QDG54197.1 pyruvate dehydrogenase (acetyl-transferring), homodimeric type [Persicimonas caeni]QED35418.1 pyruvate dehydrogenase (acetyl-transferring), homodimeric type [Persicimonas caeni]
MAEPNESSERARRERERAQIRDWLAALDDIIEREGVETAEKMLRQLQQRAAARGVELPFQFKTPYLNTIPPGDEAQFEGDPELEERILNIVRWNAMASVVRANRRLEGIGGHIGSYTSMSTLFEVGFNHFFRGQNHPEGPDKIYFQGHASTGVYARAFLEGRLDETQLENFRRELQPEGGLSSYPHPWLMPDFWEFPTVSMGLSPLMGIYQARFDRYLENRGMVENAGRVWAFCGDGEFDEPEARGALSIAALEELDNLNIVIDCNLQRLDGPVRGNGKLIQELEAVFMGAGWRVLKLLWDSAWDELLEKDVDGVLADHMESTVDGEWQRYAAEGGAYLREHFFGKDPALEQMVEGMSEHELDALARGRGGHDMKKVFAAFRAAEESERPTVILAHTIKGYGLGEAGEALNIAHKTKKLDEAHLRQFRDRFNVPVGDDQLADAPFYRPANDSREVKYVQERREKLGGYVPRRKVQAPPLEMPDDAIFDKVIENGSGGRPATTTMIAVRMLADLRKDDKVGELIVPIVPDEARTFGIEALFPQAGIYSAQEQQYEPVDANTLQSYKESTQGQILEEGITEAGSMGSFIAAGTAYATHGLNTIPFFFFYSIFGFQRIGDLIWAAADQRARGFLIGATSGRTTLNGEGLQHEDGHSHLLAYTNPRVRAYDPCFAHELAVIIRHGMREMYVNGEDVMYYVTVANEDFEHPGRDEYADQRGVDEEGIIRGMYRYRASRKSGEVRRVQLLGGGVLLREALEAQRILEDDFGVTADVWSVTSWKALYEDALDAERHNRLHPNDEEQVPYFTKKLGEEPGAVVAVSDFVKALPYSLGRFCPCEMVALGTDGLGRSESREALRDFFEVDAKHIVLAALRALAAEDRFPEGRLEKAIEQLGIDPSKPNPMTS